MKKFSYPLERVLSWRRTQARLEEAALARLRGEIQALDAQQAALNESVQVAQAGLLAIAWAAPIEIGAMERFRMSATAQTHQLQRERQAMEKKLVHQTRAVMERRREAQLLQQLRDKRYKSWQAEETREVDGLAEESYLARLIRSS
jgi:hypothetical protein